MSFKAIFKVGGKEYNVLSCSYDLNQEVDATGRPSSINRGGRVNLTVESNEDTFFFEWQCSSFERKDCSITFTKRDNDATLKTLKITEGYLVKFKEQFDSTGTNPLITSFCISAREIESGQGKHINEWK